MMARLRDDDAGFSLAELLVVIVLLGLIGTAITGVVITTSRSQTMASQLRDVMDDARFSVDRIRKEVREARRVEVGSDENTLVIWVDQNQDNIIQPDEVITFDVISAGAPGKWFLERSQGSGTQIVAQTLVNPAGGVTPPTPFQYVTPKGACSPPTTACPTPIGDARALRLDLDFDVNTNTGVSVFPVNTVIRMRNVA